MEKTLIKGGIIHTMDSENRIFQGDILTGDGKILQVAPEIREMGGLKIIDARGLIVMPGLIDAHSHIGLFDFNQTEAVDDANEMTDPVTASADARYGVNTSLPEFKAAYERGITTVLLTPGSGNVFCGLAFATKTYGSNIFDMTIKAPCAVKIALGGNPKNTYGKLNRLPMTRMGVANVLWDTFAKAKDYMEKKDRGEEPEWDDNLEAILPALRGEVPCKIHCTQHDMLTAIEVAKAYHVEFSLEHAWGATNYIDEIVESGCHICYGPIATYRAPGERRKVDIEAVKELDERGVNVAIITDSPIMPIESLYHHMGEAVREGADPDRVLRMVTINPAKILKVEDRLGSLEAGKDADIILVKGKIGLDTDARVQMTMMGGKIIYKV